MHFDGLLAQALGGRLPPGRAQLIEKTHRLWLGLHSAKGSSGVFFDSVIVLEGAFSDVSRAAWATRFLPARELGGRIRRYDARDDTRRAAVARIYERLGSVLVCASAAEVDPLERVVEGGRRERLSFPPPDGEIGWVASGAELASLWEPSSPKAGRLMGAAVTWSGSVSASADGLSSSSALEFTDAKVAERALGATRWVMTLLPPLDEGWGLKLDIGRLDRQVTFQAEASWETLLALLTRTGEASPGTGTRDDSL